MSIFSEKSKRSTLHQCETLSLLMLPLSSSISHIYLINHLYKLIPIYLINFIKTIKFLNKTLLQHNHPYSNLTRNSSNFTLYKLFPIIFCFNHQFVKFQNNVEDVIVI